MKIALTCMLLALAASAASAKCTKGEMNTVPHSWTMDLFSYCEYHGMKFIEGSKWSDAERCLECFCNDGLHCCPMNGIDTAVAEEGCVVVSDHCHPVFLNKEKNGLCNDLMYY